MDGTLFDRVVKSLADAGHRRNAVKTLAGAGLAAVTTKFGADNATASQNTCQNIGQRCGGSKICCNTSGLVSCENFPTSLCVHPGKPAGTRCCGQEGARCDPKFGTPLEPHKVSPNARGNCSCCDPLFCGKQNDGKFRCQVEDT
jgi:hypothetical protein